MKNDAFQHFHLSHGFAPEAAMKPLKQEPNLTPYLKAILTGAVNLVSKTKAGVSTRNHDLEAAIRYIRESALLKK
jgi:hypothetical protein